MKRLFGHATRCNLLKFSILMLLILCASCNKEEVITNNSLNAPIVSFDNGSGIYTIKVGEELTIEPAVENMYDATIRWTLDGEVVCEELAYTATWESVGEYYPKLTVQNQYGKAAEEVKVEVVELTPPSIFLRVPAQGLEILPDMEYKFEPTYKYDDLAEFEVEWQKDGEVVGTDRSYTFSESTLGSYNLTLNASNVDGTTTKEIAVNVVEKLTRYVSFPAQSHFRTSTDRYTFAGRALLLKADLKNFINPKYSWSVDGVAVESSDETYRFTPSKSGEYEVKLTVTDADDSSASSSVKVVCVDGDEAGQIRRGGSSIYQNRVYEWTAAPGQYINDTKSGMSGDETTPDLANEWARERLESSNFLSLGGFGGYIVVGFDHSIENSGGEYDFAISANAYDSSNEPGIVWVMQDTNGDGEPNDEWYELRGSESGKVETIQDYAVTYYRPIAPKMSVEWSDSEGESGAIAWSGYHDQDYYYPAWIAEDSYTLRGTRLSAKNYLDSASGNWINAAYGWGYADNAGSDNIVGGDTSTGIGQRNGFKISNAVLSDGTPIELQYIDFIKVQCGVNAASGQLGEISTEVCGFEDID